MLRLKQAQHFMACVVCIRHSREDQVLVGLRRCSVLKGWPLVTPCRFDHGVRENPHQVSLGTSGVETAVQTTARQIFILGSSFVTYLTNITFG